MPVLNVARPVPEAFIVCLSDGTPVPTGVALEELVEPARIYMLVGCDRCSGDHLWRPDDALYPL